MAVSTLAQTIEVTEISSVTVTDIVSDTDEEENPVYVREVRCYYKASEGAASQLVFTLRLVGSAEAKIELQAPAQTFIILLGFVPILLHALEWSSVVHLL